MKQINVVAAVIVCGTRLFATRRGYGPWQGWWEFPGGKVEPGESLQQALQREIREELAAEIVIHEPCGTVDYDYPDFHLHMSCFLCSLASDYTLLEHQSAQWVDLADLDSLQWLPADLLLIPSLKALRLAPPNASNPPQ